MKPQANPFGRTRNEAASAEELLATINKPMPHDEGAEKGVIASILQSQDRIETIDFGTSAFYVEAHRTIFAELVEMNELRLPFDDMILITKRLREKNLLDRVGGPSALSEIYTFIPSPAYFPNYCKIVREKMQQRAGILACAEIINRLQTVHPNETFDPVEAMRESATSIELVDQSEDEDDKSMSSLVGEVIDDITARMDNPGAIPGIPTGFQMIDDKTGGFYGGRLWIVTGESSDGKSTLSRQFIEAVVDSPTKTNPEVYNRGIIYTCEMQPKAEVARMISSIGRINSQDMKFGKMNRADQEKFVKVTKKIRSFDLRIINISGRKIEWVIRDIRRRRRTLAKGQRMVVVIDYVQLLQTEEKSERRQQEIAKITSKLARVTKTEDIDIILPSQVNKDGDAREAEDIKNDCDVMLKIEKIEDKQKKKSGYESYKKSSSNNDEEQSRERNIFCDKNRDGEPMWSMKVALIGAEYRFERVYA
ncbi:DnaB Replicative DNA helicase [uncultured Caudovirales phage]|uniref:DNA 5'-3' helicase n=1 Tax=uncultured Caudovirales phage TaxID=2100421 RepID=A0A6J5PF60_9CAUD|nr:DnaB Replicative DNA helicase [uncultured Caudovirales phage]